MDMVLKIIIGLLFLFLAFPIGNHLAKKTKEELKDGKRWFKIIILVCIIGVIVSLIFLNDILLFTFLFIMIVTSRSLK